MPENIKYIRISSFTKAVDDSARIEEYISIKDAIKADTSSNPWFGKHWAAFGTSITDTKYIDSHFQQPTGKYVPYLAEMSAMEVTDYGIAGGSVTTNIMEKVLETDLNTFDLVTVEGGVNDYATSKPIGKVGNKSNNTFAGAIYQIAKYVYENSNATLIFLTDYSGRYVCKTAPDGTVFVRDCSPGKLNALDLKQVDYANMMIKQCEYFGIPCIDAGQSCGINELTGELYLMDHIHSTYAGGNQYAQTVWGLLKNIMPRVINE